jgi:hypothetical protein
MARIRLQMSFLQNLGMRRMKTFRAWRFCLEEKRQGKRKIVQMKDFWQRRPGGIKGMSGHPNMRRIEDDQAQKENKQKSSDKVFQRRSSYNTPPSFINSRSPCRKYCSPFMGETMS